MNGNGSYGYLILKADALLTEMQRSLNAKPYVRTEKVQPCSPPTHQIPLQLLEIV